MFDRQLLETMSPPPSGATMRLFDEVGAKLDAIEQDKRFTLDARQAMWNELRTDAYRRLDAEVDALTAADEQAIDNERGQIVAALKSAPPALPFAATSDELLKISIRQQHESQMAMRRLLEAQRAQYATAATAVQLLEAAELSDDEALMRGVGEVLVDRLRTLAAHVPAETRPYSPEFSAFVDIEGRFSKWAKAHPSPVERLRKLEDRRKVVRRTWADARALWLRIVQWDQDIAPSAPVLTKKAS
jgi:hypothetical protein